MGGTVTVQTDKFKPGDKVRVRAEDRPGHIRTPFYIRGKVGRIERVHGEFFNPESLAFGGDGLPKRTLYMVVFDQAVVGGKSEGPKDKLLIDIYEHWLDPATKEHHP
jgi:nitrile hydratase subunit beta